MTRTTRQLVLDDNAYVDVTLRMPAALYRTVHSYCVFRELAVEQVPAVATAAIRAYFADNAPFQAWLRRHPNEAVMVPVSAVKPPRTRRRASASEHEVGAR